MDDKKSNYLTPMGSAKDRASGDNQFNSFKVEGSPACN